MRPQEPKETPRYAKSLREAAALAKCGYSTAKKYSATGQFSEEAEGWPVAELVDLVALGRAVKLPAGRSKDGAMPEDADRLLKAKADEKEEHARLAKIKREEQERRLVSADAVLQAGSRLVNAAKTRLGSIPATIAPRLEGRTADEIKQALEAEIDDALRDLAGMGRIVEAVAPESEGDADADE
jgi:hypothetical protein